MRIALYGGLFGSAMDTYAGSAPEAVLRRFLAEAGHDIDARPSGARPALDADVDVHHVHHFSEAAFHLALAGAGPFVFTSHNPFLVSDWDESESRVDAALQRRVLLRADAVVALSEREADVLARRFGVPRDRFAMIPNGLDLDRYEPGGAAADGGIELLAVGQLLPYKGHRYLLEAVARVAPTVAGLRLRIVSHRHELRAELEARAKALGVAERVVFEGPLATEDLADRYRACAVFVQPSLAECFPVTVLEAMASARPVVVTDVGGCAEQVGGAGIVVPSADATALATAIEELATDAARRERLGRAALERARALYDGREVARRHVELYERVRGNRRRAPAGRQLAARGVLAAYRRRGVVAGVVPARLKRRRVSR